MSLRSTLARSGVAFAGAAALAAIGFAAPAVAAEPDEVRTANSGRVWLDFPDAFAGHEVVVTSEVPGGQPAATETIRAVADLNGDVQADVLAGPLEVAVNATAGAPTPVADGLVAFAVRGGESSFAYDPVGRSLERVSSSTPAVPALAELESLVGIADYAISPESYEYDAPFTATFSSIVNLSTQAGMDGAVLSPVLYQDGRVEVPTADAAVASGAYEVDFTAAQTLSPGTFAAFDEYGRLVLSATLDGGTKPGETETPQPTATAEPTPTEPSETPDAVETDPPAQTAEPSETADAAPAPAPERPRGDQLATTGAEDLALLGSIGAGVLALGAAATAAGVAAKRRRA